MLTPVRAPHFLRPQQVLEKFTQTLEQSGRGGRVGKVAAS